MAAHAQTAGTETPVPGDAPSRRIIEVTTLDDQQKAAKRCPRVSASLSRS